MKNPAASDFFMKKTPTDINIAEGKTSSRISIKIPCLAVAWLTLFSLLSVVAGVVVVLSEKNLAAQQQTNVESLLIKRGARGSVMGDAFVSVADETNGVYYNPAGLAFMYSPELTLSHGIFVSDDRLNGIGYSFPTDIGSFALTADYFSGPEIPRIYQGIPKNNFSYYTGEGAFSYAFRLGDSLSIGTNLRHAIDVIDDSVANLTAIDAGFLIRTRDEVFSLGGAVNNLGTSSSSNLSPNRLYRAGFSFKWSLPEDYSDITLAFGGSITDKTGDKPRYFAALEHIGAKVLALRIGYEYIADDYQKTAADSLSQFHAGVGLRLGNFQINYSYKPMASLGDAQRIDVQWRLYGWGVRKKLTTATLKVDPPVFSPNSDTAKDNVFFIPSVTTLKKIDSWELRITSGPIAATSKRAKKEPPFFGKFLIKKFSDKETAPKIIAWDGRDESGKTAPEGIYRVTFVAEDKFRMAVPPDDKTVVIDLTPPRGKLSASTTAFIPAPDGLGEKTTFYITGMSDNYGVDFWTINITNFRGKPVKTIRPLTPPNVSVSTATQEEQYIPVVWDGRDDYYETAVPPGDYTATLVIVDNGGNRTASSIPIKVLPKADVVIVREVPKPVVELREGPKGLVVTIASNVLFETGKHELKPHATKALDEVVELLKNYPENKVTIEGYTDSTGSRETNTVLSSKRAWGVYSYLVRNGVEPSRLSVKGRGSENPRASNRTEAGRALNRRVEITIHKKEPPSIITAPIVEKSTAPANKEEEIAVSTSSAPNTVTPQPGANDEATRKNTAEILPSTSTLTAPPPAR